MAQWEIINISGQLYREEKDRHKPLLDHPLAAAAVSSRIVDYILCIGLHLTAYRQKGERKERKKKHNQSQSIGARAEPKIHRPHRSSRSHKEIIKKKREERKRNAPLDDDDDNNDNKINISSTAAAVSLLLIHFFIDSAVLLLLI